MGDWPRWTPNVATEPNYCSFAVFISHYSTEEQAEALTKLPVTIHKGPWDARVDNSAPLVLTRHDRQWQLPERDCTDEFCDRCAT